MVEHRGVAGVVAAGGEQVVGVPAAGHLVDDLPQPDVLAHVVTDQAGHLAGLHPGVGEFVADDEQVAAPAALVPAVGGGVPGHEVHRQLVRLGHLPAAATLQHDPAEVVVHPVVRLELPDLQRHPVAGGVADRAEHDLRVAGVALPQQQAEQLRQLGLEHARHVPHRAGHVEEHRDRGRLRVLGRVAALPYGAAGVDRGVHGARPAVAVGERAGAGGPAVAVRGVVHVGGPDSTAHDSS